MKLLPRSGKGDEKTEAQIAEEAPIREILKLVGSLPLLSAPKIVDEGWPGIEEEIRKQDLEKKFEKFCAYFHRQWINRRKPIEWSVYRTQHRTNNLSESFNSTLTGTLGIKSEPLMWQRKRKDTQPGTTFLPSLRKPIFLYEVMFLWQEIRGKVPRQNDVNVQFKKILGIL